jgi:hypothetical protein
MFDISRALFVSTGVPERRYPRINGHALNFFIFRYAMCIVLLYTRWVHVGQQERPEAKLINDVVDMHIAAVGTFFGGVLSKDERLLGVHREARYLLRIGRAYVG